MPYLFARSHSKSLIAENTLITVIEAFEGRAAAADKLDREGTKSQEEIHPYYDDMSVDANAIVNLLDDDPNNAYKFLELGGIETVINSQLAIFHLGLRTQLLNLTKKLFEMAPSTTNAMMPLNAVDKIVDIFEGDSDEGIKATALDILYVWLPNNPKIQARVMKMKGLEPFYEQALKLDGTAVNILLDLFHKIIEEHYQARSQKKQRNAADISKLNIYKKIGLIERLSNPGTCNGLLNIFEATWNSRSRSADITLPVFKILKKVNNHCFAVFKGNDKAIQIFKNFLDTLSEKESYFFEKGLNATESRTMLKTYIEKLKTPRNDEL